MENKVNKSCSLFDDDFFDDSSLLANLENSDFNERLEPNENADKSLLNVSALCCDEEISGYDKITGQTWVYPTNYPVRDYQFNIINAAILKNTLVSLPTGLGKTFIAAVIMYNYYRWYPLGKIVFTAPTRPLVAQQIEACYKIVALPPADTIEMTGHMAVSTRKSHWQTKRVFFATPQVVYNDIKSGICPGQKIKCLVIDEAHRARGNYAYCQIISALTDMGHTVYRVLALSATPGSKLEDVINVVKNLHIAHLELRSEGCIDVASYSHSRKINTVVIPLGEELTLLRKQYVEILDRYARRLQQLNILPQNLGNLSKGRVVMLYKEYQTKDRTARHPQHNYIMKDFTLIISLYHGLELLLKHGSRVFLNFFDEHPEKSWIQMDDNLTSLLERLRDDLGIDPLALDRSVLPDGTIPEMPKELSYGHPKFYKLKEIILDHFNKAKKDGQDTRAIVFCEYRESVNLVHCLLLQLRPLIVPQMFVGQGASGKNGKAVVSQKQQLRVMRSFRAGECNTLVCTCVAEEGLDVGSVDLIICFDISTRSPVRLVQRCGRTGRERGGQVHILVTEGREHQTLLDCMRQRDGLNKKITQSKEVENNLYKLNPRMVPRDFMPTCQKMYITVPNDNKEVAKANKVKSKKGQKNLKNMILDRASTSKVPKATTDAQNKEQQTTELENPAEQQCVSTEGQDVPTTTQISTPESQDVFKRTTTPIKTKLTKKKQKVTLSKSPGKNGDIRALFSTATKSTKSYTKLMNDLDVDSSLPTRIINILVDLTVEQANFTKKCYFCQNACNCLIFQKYHKSQKSQPFKIMNYNLYLPDISLIDNLNADMLLNYIKSPSDTSLDSICDEIKPILQVPTETAKNFDLQLDFDSMSSSPEEDKVIPKTDVANVDVGKNFDIGNLDDIFADSCSPEVKEDQNLSDPNKTLEYFGLDNFEDIFAESGDEESGKELENKTINKNISSVTLKNLPESLIEKSVEIVETNANSPVNFRPSSPSILSGRPKQMDSAPTSPILGSQNMRFNSTNISLIKSSTPISNVKRKLNLETRQVAKAPEISQTISQRDANEKTNKSMFTITQIVNMINQSDSKSSLLESHTNCNELTSESSKTLIKASDMSTSPIFSTQRKKDKNVSPLNTLETKTAENLETSPILLTQQDRQRRKFSLQETKEKDKSKSILNNTASIVIPDSDSDLDDMIEIDNEIKLLEDERKTNRTPNKRKLCEEIDDEITASPYFSKKQKLDGNRSQALTLQEKVLAALTSNKIDSIDNNFQTNFLIHSPRLSVQKENKDPSPNISPEKVSDGEKYRNNLAKLQLFRRESKLSPRKSVAHDSTIGFDHRSAARKIMFDDDDSDDDFVHNKVKRKQNYTNNADEHKFKHKVKKQTKKAREFLDLEAELTDDESASGDELSDESVGSIIDFICDNNTSHDDDDMHALYLRSVKSPLKNGVFKIPQLPKLFDKQDVLSQDVEDDTYEMDSFCVDSHIGLTQNNELTELELAEMKLKEKIKLRKKCKTVPNDDGDSPIVRRKRKNGKRQIQSDSEDST